MFIKYLQALSDYGAWVAYYYRNSDWMSESTRRRINEGMDAAWLIVQSIRMRLNRMSVSNDRTIPQARSESHLDFLWATKCMIKERWLYTSIGLQLSTECTCRMARATRIVL